MQRAAAKAEKSAPKSPLIDVYRVSKIYVNDGIETPVLFDIDLQIHSGEFIAVMGPSG